MDVLGQHATEVARHAAKQMRQFFDRVLLMYDVTRAETLYALSEILDALCIYGSCLSAREILVVGNKRDLAEELGYMVENSLLPHITVYISAFRDPPEELVKIVVRVCGSLSVGSENQTPVGTSLQVFLHRSSYPCE